MPERLGHDSDEDDHLIGTTFYNVADSDTSSGEEMEIDTEQRQNGHSIEQRQNFSLDQTVPPKH